jgi:hypothetical protein
MNPRTAMGGLSIKIEKILNYNLIIFDINKLIIKL